MGALQNSRGSASRRRGVDHGRSVIVKFAVSVLCFSSVIAGAFATSVEAQPRRSVPSVRRPRVTPVCAPGIQVVCPCRGGGQGVQVCERDGSGYGACDCGGDVRPTNAVISTTSLVSTSVGGPWASPPQALMGPPRSSGRWYGWQTLILDGSAVALSSLGIGLATQRDSAGAGAAFLIAGGLTQLLGPPIVHWAHRNVGRGFASLAFRTVLPAVGLLIGAAAGSGHSSSDQVVAMFAGAALGDALAITLDLTWLARERPTP